MGLQNTPDRVRRTFTFGAALPADRADARFVTSVGAALNDLLFLNRLYVFGQQWSLMRREPTDTESLYLMRLVVSSLFELMRLLDKGTTDSGINDLMERLSDDGKADLRRVRSLGHLRRCYERIRNGTLHYPWPSDATLRAALRSLAEEEGELEPAEGPMARIRATFADDVLVQWWIEDPEADTTEAQLKSELEEVIRGLADHVTAAIRLGFELLACYFNGLPKEVWASGSDK